MGEFERVYSRAFAVRRDNGRIICVLDPFRLLLAAVSGWMNQRQMQVADYLREENKTTWKQFLTRHWELIVAADFFTVELWTRRGLERFIGLFLIDLSTRRVEIAGVVAAANRLWSANRHADLIGLWRRSNAPPVLRRFIRQLKRMQNLSA